jgi:carboxyl-terminal processing protease
VRQAVLLLIATAALGAASDPPQQAGIPRADAALYRRMLKDIGEDIEKHSYDPGFRGIDLHARLQTAAAAVAASSSASDAIDAITKVLFEFGDSHTRFYPPQRATRAIYGWKMAAIGDAPYVISVDPDSDAAKRGLAPGDRVLWLNRIQPTRENLWQIRHYYAVVRPQAQQRVIVRKSDGREVVLDIASKVETRRLVRLEDLLDEAQDEAFDEERSRREETRRARTVLVWHLSGFLDEDAIDRAIEKARYGTGLVIDLRGNPGGKVDVFDSLVGRVFARTIQMGTRISRKGETQWVIKPRGKPYLGPLAVVVDSRSASASELFARLIQLEKRGTVIGDRTAGAVMMSQIFPHDFGAGNVTFYQTSVTVADLRMADGGSLERTGVTPDELMLPTPDDLASERDPVLAHAVASLGGTLSAADAGRLFKR